ncbi:shikimate transporter [Salinisphaera sp. Q1T1-3]|uniref:shikimate transporter n=1 Tax=Salinisphaera sp. Q1T1-3 TaxID=2321229 RepID=UPI000E75306E|nr:shikimate transporter [Salinisphaera sp. Q1T1-3]RJS91628.1 shikimate transporter [Salinisphaera sp. Q1T1-3]
MDQHTQPGHVTPDERQARRAAVASFLGAVVDWYDFLLYGIVAALVFNTQFFPAANPAVGTLAAFATFGVGFVFRPLGGVVFGHFGDRLGRKRMLLLTVLLMGGATALIGLLPNYDQIGVAAPILLVVLRAIQGFAVGGEWGGAALMAVESAPPRRRAFYSSGVQVGYGVGLLLATGTVAVLSGLLSEAAFASWGWRLPFLFTLVLVFVAYHFRQRLTESPDFVARVAASEQTPARLPVIRALRRHPGAFGQIIALRLAELLTMYIVTTFALNYSTAHLGLDRALFLNIGMAVGAISCVTIPLFAGCADRFGRRPIYTIGAALGVVCAFPFFMALTAQATFWIVVFAVLLANITHDMVVSVQQPVFAELFGTDYRYSGAGVGYQVASVIGGGFTPFIAAGLVDLAGGSWVPVAIYLTAGCLLSLIMARHIKAARTDTATTHD